VRANPRLLHKLQRTLCVSCGALYTQVQRAGRAMSERLILVLHAPAEEGYASALVAALAPTATLSVPVANISSTIQFGAGALCMVVWSRAMSEGVDRAALARLLPFGQSNTIVCRVGDAPGAEQVSALAVVNVRGDGAADAVILQAVLAEILAPAQASAVSLAGAQRRGDSLRAGRGDFLSRSALGLVGTLAAAGVAAPVITGLAAATGNQGLVDSGIRTISLPQSAGQSRSESSSPVEAGALDEADVEGSALDVWVAAQNPALTETRPELLPSASEGTELALLRVEVSAPIDMIAAHSLAREHEVLQKPVPHLGLISAPKPRSKLPASTREAVLATAAKATGDV